MPTSTEALALALYLLPGVVGVFVFESMRDREPGDGFSRAGAVVLLTLISLFVVQAVTAVPILPVTGDFKTTSPATVLSDFLTFSLLPVFAVSILLSAGAAWMSNRGIGYRAVRALGITRKTGRVDVWHQVFSTHRGNWLVVRFKNGHEYVGWPEYYSMTADPEPMLFLADAVARFPRDDGDPVEQEIEGPGVLIASLGEVESIEWLEGV